MGGAGHDDRVSGLFIAEERVRGDAGGEHWGAIRETKTVVLVGREAERESGQLRLPLGGLPEWPRLYVR